MSADEQLPVRSNESRSRLSVDTYPPALAGQAYHDGAAPGGELRVIAMLRRRRWTILFGLVAVLGGVALFTYVWPRTYESSAVVFVEQPGPRVDFPALALLERLGRSSQIETEIELLQTRHVVERVVDELDLHVVVEAEVGKKRPREVFPVFDAGPDAEPGVYRITAPPGRGYLVRDMEADSLIAEATLGSEIHFAGLTGSLPEEIPPAGITIRTSAFLSAVKLTQDRIQASRTSRDADLIDVTCEGSDPETAHELCTNVLRSYLRLRTDLQRAEATATAVFLRGQVARLGEQLADAEDRVEAYRRRNRIVALEERASEEVRQFVQLRAQRDQLEAERVALAGLIQEIEADERSSRQYRNLASFPTFLQNQAVTDLLASLVNLENQRSDLAVRRRERNVDLAVLDTRIADIERQIWSMAVSYEHSLAAQTRSLDSTLARRTRSLAVIPTQQVRSARLERQATLLEDLHRLLETRLKEAEIAEAVNLPSVRVVDAASMPLGPSSPNVRLNLGLGVLLGLAFGVTMALYREFGDTRLHERGEVVRQTGLPVLSMIPRLGHPGPLVKVSRKTADGREGSHLVQGDNRGRGRRQVARGEEEAVALEAIRSLAADLRFAGRQQENGGTRSVAVTSASRAEGKTFTACNLALVSAAQGTTTLLIDADMRACGVAAFFGFPSSGSGLSDILAGRAELTKVWVGLKVHGSELRVIPAGTSTPYSGGLLESTTFRDLLQHAVAAYDLTVIDTPPLNVITDAATIAAAVNAVVVVVREGVTDREALEITLERLGRAGGRVVGVVLNEASLPVGYASHYQYPHRAKRV